MPRPFTALQAHENRIFLDILARTGNARLAAREAGRAHSSFFERAKRHPEFALRWEAAAAAAHARFHLAGGKRGPSFDKLRTSGKRSGNPLRTEGGEPMVVRTRSGRLQVRLAHKGKLTLEAERTFLRALCATANIRLSAAAAGASAAAFYRRRRLNPAFAAEMKLALRIGYDRLEHAALERTLQAIAGPEDQAWLAGAIAGNPLPPLSFDQAFQILCLHRNNVRLDSGRPPGRPARVEHDPVAAFAAIGRNIDAIERADRYQATGSWRHADEPPAPALPPLHLVTGWSRADPAKAKHNPKIALFGGWRIEDLERRERARAASRRSS
jgi:hypothetical protein